MMIDDRGDPSSGGCSGSCDEIFPVGVARVHHMDMSVDRSGKDIEARCIDHFLRVILEGSGDPDDLSFFDMRGHPARPFWSRPKDHS